MCLLERINGLHDAARRKEGTRKIEVVITLGRVIHEEIYKVAINIWQIIKESKRSKSTHQHKCAWATEQALCKQISQESSCIHLVCACMKEKKCGNDKNEVIA